MSLTKAKKMLNTKLDKVLFVSAYIDNKQTYFKCKCDCGTEFTKQYKTVLKKLKKMKEYEAGIIPKKPIHNCGCDKRKTSHRRYLSDSLETAQPKVLKAVLKAKMSHIHNELQRTQDNLKHLNKFLIHLDTIFASERDNGQDEPKKVS